KTRGSRRECTLVCHDVVVLISIVLFNDTTTTQIYTLSLHDALPISARADYENPIRNARRDKLSAKLSPAWQRVPEQSSAHYVVQTILSASVERLRANLLSA